jgi:hypothetical protein
MVIDRQLSDRCAIYSEEESVQICAWTQWIRGNIFSDIVSRFIMVTAGFKTVQPTEK